jgi:predicted dehydrogenase
MSDPQKTTRREFLRTSAVVAAAGVAAARASSMPTTAEAMRRIIGANDRISVGHVGIGVQGMTHVRLLHENAAAGLNNNTQQIAVCDLWGTARKQGQALLGLQDSQSFDDYRKLLAVKEIDAVWVTTSDNWHAQIAIDALNAGKHVYVEKPMCKTMEENFALYDAVKKTGKILQVGSQGCTDEKWHVAGKVVKDGKIGHVVLGQGSYMRNGKVGEWNDYKKIDPAASPTASGDNYVNWEMFRKGQGPKEWDPDRYFRWRKWWAYGSGVIGDLFPHRLHPLFIAMNLSTEGTNGFPLRVSSQGGLYVQKINPETGKPDREVPDFNTITVDFGDCTMIAMSSTINEQGWPDCIRGNKATLYFGGAGVELKPERVWSDEIDESTEPVNGPKEDITLHEKNFLDCIRTNGVPNCNIEIATRVQTMISLAERSYRESKMFTFDPKTRKVTG